MILKRLVKFGFFLQVLVLVISAILLWFPSFIHPVLPDKPASAGILYVVVSEALNGLPLASTLFAFFCALAMSLLFYFVVSLNELLPRDHLLIAILLMFLLSWNPSLLKLYPILPAGIFILGAFIPLMKIYAIQDPYRQVFTASMSISIASLIYIPVVYLLPLIWLSFLTYRITGWREWIIVLIGFSLPYLYWITWLFVTDEMSVSLAALITEIIPERLTFSIPDYKALIWMSTSGFMLAMAGLIHINFIQDKLISIRRRSFLMITFTFLSLLIMVLSSDPLTDSFTLLYIPLAFFLTNAIVLVKKSKVPELLIIIFIALLIVLRNL